MRGYAPRLALLLFTLLLAACAPPPFERADLEAVVFRSGDLPPEWSAGQSYGGMVGDPDLRRFSVSHELLRGPDAGGEVSVGLYHRRDEAVETLVWLLRTTPTGAVEAVLVGEAGFVGRDSLMFQRGLCVAVLELDTAEGQTRDLLEHYGRRLDDRLGALGC